MEITLSPETAQRIRSALETEVDLSPPAVPVALSRLAVEAPAVYSVVLTELSGSQIRLDSERELQRRHRRGLLRRAFFCWGEYKTDVGDRLIAKRRVAAAIPFGIASFILILWGVSGLVAHWSTPAPGDAGTAHALSTSTHGGPGQRQGSARPVRLLRQAEAPVLPLLAMRGPAAVPSAAPFPNRGPTAPPENPIVFDRQRAPLLMAPAGLRTDRGATPTPLVFVRSASGSEGPLRDASGSGEGPPATSAQAGNPQAGYRWVPGQRVTAHLATGVVVVMGGPPMPVIAESGSPRATWLGQATIGAEGLVQVTFTSASSPGQQGGVRGVALDPVHQIPGLAGRMTLRGPHAAAAVMTATLQAAGDYVQALARQGETVVGDGWAQVTVGQTAPAWTYAASRLAQVLDPSSGAGSQIETVEIAAGSPLMILVTEAP